MLRQGSGRAAARPVSALMVTTVVACGAALMVSALNMRQHAGQTDTEAARVFPAAVRLTPAAWRVPKTPDTPQVTPAVKIEIGDANGEPSGLDALREALGSDVVPPHSDASNAAPAGGQAQNEALASETLPAWFTWGRLGGRRADVHIAAPADLPPNTLSVYAVRDEDGVALCLLNKTTGRLLTNASVRLPRGVYCIERLLSGREEGRGKEGKREGEEPASSFLVPPSSSPKLERLEGCDAGGATTVSKSLCLEPGQMCVYRYTDMARTARASWYEVFGQLHAMAGNHPGPAHRLGTMLHEADGYLSGVRGNARHEGLEGRLGCIHHLLLVTAQAHSLHHNYQMRHTVDEAEGKAVMGALDRLTDALSETSAVLLGLIPQIEAAPTAAVSATNSPKNASLTNSGFSANEQAGKLTGKEEKPQDAANNLSDVSSRTRRVTITLANTGAQSVHNVKLGLNTNGLPAGVVCEPADPAYFDALHPGQTVRATFGVRVPAGQELSLASLRGDVSYFAGSSSPAHLRPRAW